MVSTHSRLLYWICLGMIVSNGLVFSGCATPAPPAPPGPTAAQVQARYAALERTRKAQLPSKEAEARKAPGMVQVASCIREAGWAIQSAEVVRATAEELGPAKSALASSEKAFNRALTFLPWRENSWSLTAQSDCLTARDLADKAGLAVVARQARPDSRTVARNDLPQTSPTRVVLESFPPPAIVLTSPAPGTVTDREQVELLGGVQAVASAPVTDVQVLMNGEAVGGEAVIPATGKPRVDLRRTLALRMGENRIEVVAKNDRGLTARETLIVRRVEPRGPTGKLPKLEALSDVDRYTLERPPREANPRRWAVIIGIEKYQRTVAAPFARRDAYIVHEYVRKLLGVPAENIFLLVDEEATGNALKVVLEDRLPRRVQPGGQVFVYFSGHGLADPDPRARRPYLLPADGDPQSIQLSGYSAEAFYGALGRLQAERVVVFLDACYGGVAARQEELQPLLSGVKPGLLRVTEPALVYQHLTVLAAAQNHQVSNVDPETGHGLFTYHLLKGLMGSADVNRDGQVGLRELAVYVRDTVDRVVRQRFGQTREQTPVLMPSELDPGRDIVLVEKR